MKKKCYAELNLAPFTITVRLHFKKFQSPPRSSGVLTLDLEDWAAMKAFLQARYDYIEDIIENERP